MASMQPESRETPPPAGGAVKRPFEVRVDSARHGAFRDMRDAIAAAKIAKRESPKAVVGVTDSTTGQFVVIDG